MRDKIFIQFADLFFIRSRMPSQIALVLNWAPKGKPKCIQAKVEILHPRMSASAPIFSTSPIGTISDLFGYIFNLVTASNSKRVHWRYHNCCGIASHIMSISSVKCKCEIFIITLFAFTEISNKKVFTEKQMLVINDRLLVAWIWVC